VAEPVVSACGVPVGKMSGRGLSFTGGTLDKMESFAGYRVDLTMEEFLQQLDQIGLVLAGQTADLAPADGKLYALRDVTGTVPSIPLIASSVMSKKIAAGAQAILLDVKLGSGAFMPDQEQAERLARLMVEIGDHAGRKVVALLSDMNQPLGRAVGNALEVKEAIATLSGGGPSDFREHALVVAGHMLTLGGAADDPEHGRQLAAEALEDGRALDKFRLLVEAQGGEPLWVDEPGNLPQASLIEQVEASHSGVLAEINARQVGLAVVGLGGGRQKKGDPIDPAVGVLIHHNVGDEVNAGQPLFEVHANDQAKLAEARQMILAAHRIVEGPVEPLPLFYGSFGG
jgi:pyrimidine-nucleoside phosphorylase